MKTIPTIVVAAAFIVFASLTARTENESGSLRAAQVRKERQPIADQENGLYRNPVLAGNYGDPSVVKVGKDYYLAKSLGDGFIVWHSRDLVNWRPVTRHTFDDLSGIWAVDLQYLNGRFHLFMPVGKWPGKTKEHYRANFVIHARQPEGPWSAPHRIDREFIPDDYYTGIDPGFLQTPEGKKFLYTDHGYVMPLSDELIATAQPKRVYDGWPYPKDWIVEGFCLESPKLFRRDGWYYLVSAQGGTSGPSTAHMAVVARSKSPTGPWENSPFNPLIRTYSASEKWWQQGHATLVEGPDGHSWWAIYHARLNGCTGIGRQTLLLPVAWTPDGWPVIKDHAIAGDPLPMPKGGENVGHGLPLSGDFVSDQLGIQWTGSPASLACLRCGAGSLVMEPAGAETVAISLGAPNPGFEAVVQVECSADVTAGLCFGNGEGLKTNGRIVSYNKGEKWRTRDTDVPVKNGRRVWLKIRNHHQDLSLYSSDDGVEWTTFQNGARADEYTVQLFARGNGCAVFRHFTYLGLE
jgi:beta-xylosidase